MWKNCVCLCVWMQMTILVCVWLLNVMWGYFLFINGVYFLPIHLSSPVEECSYWLPLYGSMCCRLAAQPHCMTQQMMSGCLKVKVSWQVCVRQWWGVGVGGYSSHGFHSFWLLSWFISVLFSSSTSLLSFVCCHVSVFLCLSFTAHLTDLFLYLAAVGRWPSELDKSVRRSKRNKPLLLPPARRCGGQRWASFHYCHQQGQ